MSDIPDRGPHHADDTGGDDVILVEFTAKLLPHDSPEFQERARRPRPPRNPPPAEEPKPEQEPPAAT